MIWTIVILLALVVSVFGYRYYLLLTLTSGDKILASPHFVGGKFVNSVPNKKYTIKEIVGMVFKSGQKDQKPSKPLPVENLDKNVILYLANKALSFFVPLGVGKRLQKWGVDKSKILEFNWCDAVRIGDIKIASTPARHYSSRNLLDKDFTFWCSWSLIGGGYRIFFSGDTGTFPSFAEIGERYGPFDLTFI